MSKLGISISEEIKAVLYDNKSITDVCEVNGIVQCKVSSLNSIVTFKIALAIF